MEQRACENCYHSCNPTPQIGWVVLETHPVLECRLLAPYSNHAGMKFPFVKLDDWCGKFESKAKEGHRQRQHSHHEELVDRIGELLANRQKTAENISEILYGNH